MSGISEERLFKWQILEINRQRPARPFLVTLRLIVRLRFGSRKSLQPIQESVKEQIQLNLEIIWLVCVQRELMNEEIYSFG